MWNVLSKTKYYSGLVLHQEGTKNIKMTPTAVNRKLLPTHNWWAQHKIYMQDTTEGNPQWRQVN